MRLWLARDKDGELNLFTQKPYYNESPSFKPGWDISTANENDWIDSMMVESSLFPEVTWENSPVEFDLVEVNPITEETKKEEPWSIYNANDGDIVFYKNHYDISLIIIFESLRYSYEYEPADGINHYLLYCPEEDWFDQNTIMYVNYWDMERFHPATEEQKQILFNALEKYGYKWDPEDKTIIKL